MKKLLFLMFVLFIPFKGWAYEEGPKMLAIYDQETATLNFVYDVIYHTDGTVDTDRTVKCGTFSFNVPAGTDRWSYEDYGWYTPPSTLYDHTAGWWNLPIKRIKFYPSFANARPEYINDWFTRLRSLEEIRLIR